MTRIETAIAAVALAFIAAGCHDPGPPRTATVVHQEKNKARSDRLPKEDRAPAADQKSEAYVITGDSDAPKAVPPAVKQGKGRSGKQARPPAEPPTKEPTFYAEGTFMPTPEKGRDSAIEAAVEKLHEYLMQQDPPVTKYPTKDLVRKMIVRHPKASDADVEYGKVTLNTEELLAGTKEETLYRVEIALRVEPEQVRELRAQERSGEALWVVAGVAALALVLAAFFRIDAWTKGYLTSWLVLGTIGAAGLLFGLLWFAR
jgi:hypothetical protein